MQKYIFSGSKLSTYIGASHNTANLFRTVMCGVLTEMIREGRLQMSGPEAEWAEAWKQLGREATYDSFPEGDDFIVAQIGGGKIILIFRPELVPDGDTSLLKAVINRFTKKVLRLYPGLHTGAVIGEVILDEHFFDRQQSGREPYGYGIESLFKALHDNQDTVYPVVSPPYTGLTLTCTVNGEPASHYDADHTIRTDWQEKPRFFSQEVYAKAAAARTTNDYIRTEFFKNECGDYELPLEFEQLGYKEGESYIAVVHIDGNKMGVKFQGCRTWGAYNATALSVQESTKEAYRKLVRYIAERYGNWQESGELALDGRHLPIRPLILGGDDVAFVCTARIALEATRYYMEALLHPEQDSAANGQQAQGASLMPIYSCAGIAIIPAKYPFGRGYELAEQLCSEAKKMSRGIPDDDGNTPDSCWLDFAILHGEQEPELTQIRRQEYSARKGSLHFGPYLVAQSKDAPPANMFFHVQHLLDCVKALRSGMHRKGGVPHGKLKELRSVLAHDEHGMKAYLTQLQHLKLQLPCIEGWDGMEKDLWQLCTEETNGSRHEVWRTPYVDAIEMLDFTMKEAEPSGE